MHIHLSEDSCKTVREALSLAFIALSLERGRHVGVGGVADDPIPASVTAIYDGEKRILQPHKIPFEVGAEESPLLGVGRAYLETSWTLPGGTEGQGQIDPQGVKALVVQADSEATTTVDHNGRIAVIEAEDEADGADE